MNLGLSRLPKAWRWTGVAVLLLAGAAVGAVWADRHLPYYHFRTVQKGVFYRSSLLKPADLEHVIDDYGIKTVVNLRDDQRPARRATGTRRRRRSPRRRGSGTSTSPAPARRRPRRTRSPSCCACGTTPRAVRSSSTARRGRCAAPRPRASGASSTWARPRRRPATASRRGVGASTKDAPKIAEFLTSYVPRRDQPSAK